MYEYGIWNAKTNQQNVIFGRTFNRACERAHIDSEDWEILWIEYID